MFSVLFNGGDSGDKDVSATARFVRATSANGASANGVSMSVDGLTGGKSTGEMTDVDVTAPTESSVRSEAIWLQSIFMHLRELMIKLWNVSPMILDELQSLIAQIGRNDAITELYETISSRELWLAAIQPYERPAIVATMFGMIRYVHRNDLDRQVYSVLSEQSLAVAYNTYLSIATEDRLRLMIRLVETVEYAKMCATVDTQQLSRLTKALHTVLLQHGSRTAHIVTHTCANALLSIVNTDAIREMGNAYAIAIEETTRNFADSIDRARTMVQQRVVVSQQQSHSQYQQQLQYRPQYPRYIEQENGESSGHDDHNLSSLASSLVTSVEMESHRDSNDGIIVSSSMSSRKRKNNKDCESAKVTTGNRRKTGRKY